MIQLNTDTIKVKENGQWSNLSSLTGPQGERGATGATGPQGPQGIPGVPGYPTIETGDAGKVLTVNSSETAVEWDTLISGLNIITTTSYNFTMTQDQIDSLEIGKSAIAYNTINGTYGNNCLYILSNIYPYDDDGTTYYQYEFASVYDTVAATGSNDINGPLAFTGSNKDGNFWQVRLSAGTVFNTYSMEQVTDGNWSDGQTGKFQLVANVTHHDPDGTGGWNDYTYAWELVQ